MSILILGLVLFLGVLYYLQYINFKYDPYKQPSTAGVKNLRGTYAVTEFRINNRALPYNPLDSVRWAEATFENWTTLTYTVNKPTFIDLSNGGGDPQRDVNRTFELTGVAGGRRVFHYYVDTVDKVLYLQDKFKKIPDRRNIAAGVGGDGNDYNNKRKSEEQAGLAAKKQHDDKATVPWISQTAWAHIGNEVDFIDKRAASARRDREFEAAKKLKEKRNRMVLSYDTKDGSRVVLRGINENKDSLYIVLDRINKKYALSESNLVAGKYE